MGVKLPEMSRAEFEKGVAAVSPQPLTAAAMSALYAHDQDGRVVAVGGRRS